MTAAGSYVLTVTNANGCTATATTNVSANLAQPVVGIAQPGMFLCNTDSLQLSASQTSSSGPGFSMAWASQNGTILSGQNTPMPWVGNAAIYTLTITDLTNGCTASASTTVSANTTPPIAQAGQNATLDCISTPVGLDGSGSSTGPSFSYQWTTTGGNIVSGGSSLMPEVNGVGTYFLTVENSANGCSAIDSVAVAQDASAPTVVIAPANQLDCDTDEITLNATGSSVGTNITITWNGPSFTDGVNTLTPTVNQPGVYQLILLNQSNNCVANASMTVMQDTVAPIADAGPAPVLDCSTPSAMLDGSGSSQGPSMSYLWSTGEASQSISVSNPGNYTLTVNNSTNGCSASDAVTVISFGNLPNVDIDPPGSLNCAVAQLQLSATAPVGSEYFYNWTFTGTGTGIISGAGSLTPTIGSPGTYTLTVTNVQTGCSASESVLVAQNGNLPTAEAGAPQTLLCGQTSVSLNGAGSSSGAGIAYLWETQNGSILEDGTTLAPTVNAPGIYTLTVTDLQSGCSATDEVQVGQDANAPTADAGAPQTLDCSVQQVTLDGTGSSSGPGFTYLWTTSDGLISAGANTLTPIVTAAGTYLLTVTNTQNNCQTLASVQVVDLAQPPTAVATTNQQLGCGTQPIALSGMGSSTGTVYAYLWAGPGVASGGTTLSPLVNAPGIYTLTVTNLANTCTSTAQVTVIQNSTPPTAVAAAPQSITCLLQQVPLSGTGSSTGAGFSYQWQGPGIMLGGMTLMPTANAGGVYTLTVTGPNGCTATATAIVTANTTPPTAIAAAPLGLGCGAQQVQLDGTGSSTGASVFYLWQGPGLVSGQTTLTPTVNAPGTYTLTVANQANGCSATATATVNQDNPSVIAVTNAPQPLTCALTTTSIDATGSSAGANILYDWTGPGVASGDDAIQVFVTEPGTYTLTVTDQATGCTATTTAIVSADSVPPMADAGPNLLIGCSNDTLTLVGTTNVLNAEFLWTTWIVGSIIGNTAQSTILIDEPGRYVLQVTNLDNGCAAFDTAHVNNDISSAIFPSINSNITHCQNPFSQVWFEGGEGGNPPFMLSMDGGNSFFTIDTILENLPSGIYNFVVIDANGCNSNQGIDFTAFPPFSVELPQILSLEFGSQGSLIPNISIPDSFIQSIVWSPGEGLSCTDCLQPMVYPLSNTFYVVTVTNKDGCSASASIMVEVSKPEGSIYVPNIFSPNGDGINDVLVVFADENQVKTIPSFQVFSRWGEAVFQGFGLQPNDATTGWDGTHRGKDVDLGVFVWYAEVELVTGERKLLKGDVAITR
ncbi:MAG: gliding motility-associated C-terminal domain-containing protein [Saprospiraceae bacterium]|nr:gliding motility-associated C-terminal domain-containing protein [Saprospiraceae bacterium]